MIHLKKFEEVNWVSTSSTGQEFNMNNDDNMRVQYISKNKTYYGIHEITVANGERKVKVRAKFDTGANSSSIDFEVARKLGFSKKLIARCTQLEKFAVPRNITFIQQRQLERRIYLALRREFPVIKDVKLVKSSSGFSVRICVAITIEYSDRVIKTVVNIRNRSGLAADMLVGLKNML